MSYRCDSCSRNISFHRVDCLDPRAIAEHHYDCRWVRDNKLKTQPGKPQMVSLDWVLSELSNKKFPNRSEAHDYLAERFKVEDKSEERERITVHAESWVASPQDGKLTTPSRKLIYPGVVLRMVNSDGTVAPYSDATVLGVGVRGVTILRPFMHIFPNPEGHVGSAGREKLEVLWENLLADKTCWRVVLTARGKPHEYITNK